MAKYQSYTNASGRTVHYDEAGNKVGVSYRSKSGGRVTHYDAAGNKTGQSYVNASGRMTHYNAQGEKTGTSYTAYPGRIRHYDNNWQKTGDTTNRFLRHSTETSGGTSTPGTGSGMPAGGAGCATLAVMALAFVLAGVSLLG
jgi:hypothetical protein